MSGRGARRHSGPLQWSRLRPDPVPTALPAPPEPSHILWLIACVEFVVRFISRATYWFEAVLAACLTGPDQSRPQREGRLWGAEGQGMTRMTTHAGTMYHGGVHLGVTSMRPACGACGRGEVKWFRVKTVRVRIHSRFLVTLLLHYTGNFE